jgi:hypothetical protein
MADRTSWINDKGVKVSVRPDQEEFARSRGYRPAGESAEGTVYRSVDSDEGVGSWLAQKASDMGLTGGDIGHDNSFAQSMSGVNEGIAGMVGYIPDYINNAENQLQRLSNWGLGTEFDTQDQHPLGGESIRQLMRDQGAIREKSDNMGHQMLRRVGEEVGASVIPAGVAHRLAGGAMSLGKTVTGSLSDAIGSGTGAAIAQQVAPDNPIAEIVGALAGGSITGLSGAAKSRRSQIKDATEALPDDVFIQGAKDAMDKAYKNGTDIEPDDFLKFRRTLKKELKEAGVVNRLTGKPIKKAEQLKGIMSDIDTEARAILRARRNDNKASPVKSKNMKEVNSSISDMLNSNVGKERRAGSITRNVFDDMIAEPHLDDIAGSRDQYRRAMNLQDINRRSDKAAIRSGRNKGRKDLDTSLRMFLGQEAEKIAMDKSRGWKPWEVDALNKTAAGPSAIREGARALGKVTPTGGIVSSLPAYMAFDQVTNLTGSPSAGLAAGGGVASVGILAKMLADNLSIDEVDALKIILKQGKDWKKPPILGATGVAQRALTAGARTGSTMED